MRESIMTFLILAVAGSLGVLLRSWLNQKAYFSYDFPWSTLIINVFGSFAAGLMYALFLKHSESVWSTIIMVGFLGALTTYSSFVLDGLKLIEKGQWGLAFTYMGVTHVSAFLLCYFGFFLGNRFTSV